MLGFKFSKMGSCYGLVPVDLTQSSLGLLNTHWWNHAIPDSKLHGANVEPIWGRQDPGGLHVGHLAIWDSTVPENHTDKCDNNAQQVSTKNHEHG